MSSSLSPRQLASLKAIAHALLPPLDVPADSSTENSTAIDQFWSHELPDDFFVVLQETITTKLSATESKKLKFLLLLLSNAVGSSVLFQRPSTTAFSGWPRSEQTRALQNLQHSCVTQKREIFSGLKRLICGLAFSYIPSNATRNPFWDAMEYPGPPPNMKKEAGLDPAALFQVTEDTMLDYDIVIVGSGAGGGVAAAVLSQSGYKVVVLEKGPYIPYTNISNLECEALDQMYEKHALLTARDGNITILAGSTLGGGTAINWACCLPLPDTVRDEWSSEHGLVQFQSQAYQQSLQAVKSRIGCHFPEQHNAMNQKMKDGCEALGYTCESTGQNLCDTSIAGYTSFGAPGKQSGVVTFLNDAVTNGARIMENAQVQRVLTQTVDGRKRAVGIVANVGDYRVQVNARSCVIVAAGSLHTPCLLQRSGFRNPHIGRHLHVHPVTAAVGFFDETIHPYIGAPMTTVCNRFPDVKLECPSAHTGLAAVVLPFRNPHDFKDKMLRLKHMAPFIVLQRDTVSEGRVWVGDDGFSPCIDYELKEPEKLSMMNALKGLVKILIASGANHVCTGHNDDPGLPLLNATFESAADIDDSIKVRKYLNSIDERGMEKHKIGVFSAHQMSTCRMSTSHKDGVVDENGESWECDDLLIMDASIFPTASGANPMLTTLTLSHMLSTRLVERLQMKEKGQEDSTTGAKEWVEERKRKRARQPQYGFDIASMLPRIGVGVVVVAVLVRYYKRD
jgi:choline dehydrogenase-like flavoprotein